MLSAVMACVDCALKGPFASGVGCDGGLTEEADKDVGTCADCLKMFNKEERSAKKTLC